MCICKFYQNFCLIFEMFPFKSNKLKMFIYGRYTLFTGVCFSSYAVNHRRHLETQLEFADVIIRVLVLRRGLIRRLVFQIRAIKSPRKLRKEYRAY
ncbi:hypothetical protein VNO77_45154 [Canavalia gladiata]|uniref:Uncharacterized protein n=1 Tax=Canavalia gladiata TaxID=3824 RepID=A0AAN9JTX6_CANGL